MEVPWINRTLYIFTRCIKIIRCFHWRIIFPAFLNSNISFKNKKTHVADVLFPYDWHHQCVSILVQTCLILFLYIPRTYHWFCLQNYWKQDTTDNQKFAQIFSSKSQKLFLLIYLKYKVEWCLSVHQSICQSVCLSVCPLRSQ